MTNFRRTTKTSEILTPYGVLLDVTKWVCFAEHGGFFVPLWKLRTWWKFVLNVVYRLPTILARHTNKSFRAVKDRGKRFALDSVKHCLRATNRLETIFSSYIFFQIIRCVGQLRSSQRKGAYFHSAHFQRANYWPLDLCKVWAWRIMLPYLISQALWTFNFVCTLIICKYLL